MRGSHVNYPPERTGQNGGTPFFQPQDQRGPVPNAGNGFQFGHLQGWNTSTNPHDVQRGALPGQPYNQHAHMMMKGQHLQPPDESIDLKGNVNLSPMLLGDSQKLGYMGGGSAAPGGVLGGGKDEATSQRKLQK